MDSGGVWFRLRILSVVENKKNREEMNRNE